MDTEIKSTVEAADYEARYDENAKKILANKYVLAHILVKTVDEFKGMDFKDVVRHIEGEPMISSVPVEPGRTNRKSAGENIAGLNTEASEVNEGLIRYDIIFYVRMRDGLSRIIVNVEAQKDEPSGYKIINRAVFYAGRLVSSQKGRDFVNQDYDDIKRVFSIWICMNVRQNCMNYIHLANDSVLGSYEWKGRTDLVNIVLIGLSGEIPEENESGYELHRLLGTVFSDGLAPEHKLKVMETEYNIPMKQDIKEDLEKMCNLGQGISERAEARGEAIGEARGKAEGIIETAYDFGLSDNDILERLQSKLNVSLSQAQQYLNMFGRKEAVK